jgi:hypothetical protein
MSGGTFTRCESCRRLLIYGQQCVCHDRPMRYFIDGVEVSEAVAQRAEKRGAAHVVRGGSGVVPKELRAPGETEEQWCCPWLEMLPRRT